MAKKLEGAAGAAPDSPTFSEAIEQSRQRTDAEAAARQRIVESAPTAAPASTPPSAPEAPSGEETYEQWLEKQPAQFRDKYAESVTLQMGKSLADFYGPEITELLNEARQDPALLKKLGRMSKKDFRDWVLDNAADIYDRTAERYSPETQPRTDSDKKFDELSQAIAKERQDREWDKYQTQRRTEYEALLNTFPELQFNNDTNSPIYKKVAAIVEETEDRSRRENRIIPYAETYQKMRDMWTDQANNPPPPVIPRAQARSAEPPKPQAPRNKTEAREAMKSTLDKFGSLTELQAALRK